MTTKPTIHLNGTSAQSLFDEYHAFYKALDSAASYLASATCNPRDFYPQGENAWPQARAERDQAFELLKQLQDYAEVWVEAAAERLR